MDGFFKWVAGNPGVFAAIVGFVGVIVGGFLTSVIWPLVKQSVERFFDHLMAFLTGRRVEILYLDWLIRQHQYLPILPTTLVPVTDTAPQELDKLYVSLSVTEGADHKGIISLAAAIQTGSPLVILGDPGAGKTTMLRFLALTFAKAKRKRLPGSRPDSHKQLGVREARRQVREVFGFRACPTPVFLYLNRLHTESDRTTERTLLDFISDELKSAPTLRNLPRDFLSRKFDAGQCLFLLDAFDELATQEARSTIAKQIGALVSAAPPGNRFIVTSRIVGYSGQLASYGFRVLTVQRLSWELVSELVTRWYEVLNEPGLGVELLQTFRSNARIYELAINPMLLSLIVLVQYVRRLIPDRRHVLYDECIKILVERRSAPPSVQQEYNKLLPGEEATRILREIAAWMHGMRLREVPRRRLEVEIVPKIVATNPQSPVTGVPSMQILENIEQRSQLLVERGLNEQGQTVMAFSHLTFQEYLASAALKQRTGDQGEAAVSSDLLSYFSRDPDWWEEVALLYAAQLEGIQQQSFFERLYPAENILTEEGHGRAKVET